MPSHPNASKAKVSREPHARYLFMGLTSLALLSACGNGWITSDDREQTPSARFLKAQLQYDKGKFAEAADIYQQLLADDPNNDRARVRLSYALNGMAGLAPIELLTKLSKIQTSIPKASASGATGTKGTAAANAASLTSLTSAAGLTKAQREAVVKANPTTYRDLVEAATKFKSLAKSDPKTYEQLVSASKRVRNLRASWLTICQLIPARVLDAVVGTNPVRRKGLESDECRGGNPNQYQNPAVLFAAAMESLAQGATLYQIKLDTDGDGTVDLVKKAETLTKDIASLNSRAQDVSDPVEISARLTSLNEKVDALNLIGATLKSELVDLTMAHFEIMSALVTAIENVVPENVSKSLLNGVKKFEESKSKIGGYVTNTGAGKGTTANNNTIQASAKAAAATADTFFDTYVTKVRADPALTTDQKAAKEQEFGQQFSKTCDNFDAMRTTYGLPATVEKPSNCAKVATLTLADREGDGDEAEATPFLVFDLPASSDPVLESRDAGRDLVEFARLGDRLLSDE